MTPYTIATIAQQAGGQGINGSFAYIGASDLAYKHPQRDHDRECRPDQPSTIDPVTGTLQADVALLFRVNGKRGQGWTMTISYEPDDTYSVYLFRLASKKERTTGRLAQALDQRGDVYADELQGVIEAMYDAAIQKHNNGFINI